MRLTFPPSLHYPVTVTEVLKLPNDDVERLEPLFSYSYTSTFESIDRDGNAAPYEQIIPSRFESTVEGKLQKWFLKKGDVISGPGGDIVEVEEPCTHSVQFGGMCATCGKDMTERSYVTTQIDANRAKIRMVHDNTALTVSPEEARRAEDEAKRRLLQSRRLSLVVDLDQTIIHATVDPTVAEWKKNPENPNYEALKDVKAFQLNDDAPTANPTWYYIKLRPGLTKFLENVATMYELHIYTMGTRAYAQNIAKIMDPERKIFGDRILSRDESGSLVAKNLQRIFPVDTNMVVVIDDRGDVWNWTTSLVKVTQFSFFTGIGDINSSFLPKKPKIRTTPPPEQQAPKEVNGKEGSTSIVNSETIAQAAPAAQEPNGTTTNSQSSSALEQLVAMGGGDDPATLQEQTAKQDQALKAQLEDRPLLQMQKQLDAEDESDSDSEKPRHHLLNDNDNELEHLENSLRKVHIEFYKAYDGKLADVSGGRLAELRGTQSISKRMQPSSNLDLAIIPDIKTIMPNIKSRVLAGVSIVFSGVIPLDTDVQSAEISIWARSFGAKIQDKVSGKQTTHVVAARNRTAKVRQAVRRGKGRIKVVSFPWLMESIIQWKKLDETPYLLRTEADDLGKPFPGEDAEILSESEDVPSSHDTDTDANNTESEDINPQSLRPLRITIKPPKPRSATASTTGDDEDLKELEPRGEFEDQKSPVGGTNEDWDKMRDEMAEFLGSDAEDSDVESVASSVTSLRADTSPRLGGKRDRDEDNDDDGEMDDGKPPVKKHKESKLRVEQSGLPTPGDTAEINEDDGEWDSRSLDDEFEREMEAALNEHDDATDD